MAFLPLLDAEGFNIYRQEDYKNSPEHVKLTKRLCKTLYYGKTPSTDRPSLPLTGIAVGFFQDASPKELGRVDCDYASFVSRRSCMSPCSMMLGMVYIDRLKHRNPDYLQTISSSDLFLISMMMASKYLYDEGVDEEVFNDEWAESAQMEIEDLNELERNFLGAINWNLFIKPLDFHDVLKRVERSIALNQGQERGWFSYTDLYVLMEDLNYLDSIQALLKDMAKVMVVFAVAYAASILTVIGSMASVSCLRSQLLALEVGRTPVTESVTNVIPLHDESPIGMDESELLTNSDYHLGLELGDNDHKDPGFDGLVGRLVPGFSSVIHAKDALHGLVLTLMDKEEVKQGTRASQMNSHHESTKIQGEGKSTGMVCEKGWCSLDKERCKNITNAATGSGPDKTLPLFSKSTHAKDWCSPHDNDRLWKGPLDVRNLPLIHRPACSPNVQHCCCPVDVESKRSQHIRKQAGHGLVLGLGTRVPAF